MLTTLQLRDCSRNLEYLFKVASEGSGIKRAYLNHPKARPLG